MRERSAARDRRVRAAIGAVAAAMLLPVPFASMPLPAQRAAGAAVIGLDHIPTAVRDLDAATRRYGALGFALKPGRPHGNGIINAHVKFPDGTELELITAPEARDGLTAKYRRHLADGDGPAFLAFYTESLDGVAAALQELEIAHRKLSAMVDISDTDPLDYIFFGGRNKSPTDRPEHFAHANTAESLTGVWLAGEDLSREMRMLQRLGADLMAAEREGPDGRRHVRLARLPEGEVRLLPGSAQQISGRRIVGATVRVRDLAAARKLLERDPAVAPALVARPGSSSILLPPSVTHGLWLELRQGAG
jgi:hypothetical protein